MSLRERVGRLERLFEDRQRVQAAADRRGADICGEIADRLGRYGRRLAERYPDGIPSEARLTPAEQIALLFVGGATAEELRDALDQLHEDLQNDYDFTRGWEPGRRLPALRGWEGRRLHRPSPTMAVRSARMRF